MLQALFSILLFFLLSSTLVELITGTHQNTSEPTRSPSISPNHSGATWPPSLSPINSPSAPSLSPTIFPTPRKPSPTPSMNPTQPTSSPTIDSKFLKPISSICTGTAHLCVLFEGLGMKCVGYEAAFGMSNLDLNMFGDSLDEVGNRIPFIDPGKSVSIEKISCGANSVCMVLSSGQIKCLGNNFNNVLGLPPSASPVGAWNGYSGENLPVVNLGSNIVVIGLATGETHGCVLLNENRVKCFGSNGNGELGYGDTAYRGELYSSMFGDNLPFVNFGADIEVASVHSGAKCWYNCVILLNPAQRVKCWGYNQDSQLAYGDTNNRGDETNEMGDYLELLDFGPESRVKQLTLALYHACALLIDDTLKCWGSGEFGGFGSGSTNWISSTGSLISTVLIEPGKKIKLIAAAYSHTCIVYDDMATMKCVGNNNFGQLGQGDTESRGNTPDTTFPNIPAIDFGTGSMNITSIHCGTFKTCAIFSNNGLKCFGSNMGQFAVGLGGSIGDEPGEKGTNLNYSVFFSEPTSTPTCTPTKSPTFEPSSKPTNLPANSPIEENSSKTSEVANMSLILGISISFSLLLLVAAFVVIQRKRRQQLQPSHALTLSGEEIKLGYVEPAHESVSSSLPKLTKKKYIAFLSHCKTETGPTASLIYEESAKILKKKGTKRLPMFIDNEHLIDLRGLPERVSESKVMIAMLSKSYLSRPWCLIELHYALEYNIPIIAINVIGAGYDFEEAKYFLEHLSIETLNVVNSGASKELKALDIDISNLGKRLYKALPNIIANEYNPNSQSRIRDAQLDIIIDHVILNANLYPQ